MLPCGRQPSPPPHLRRRQLSFRVELSPPESTYVGGGGVVLGPMRQTVTPGMGNALILPAKLRWVSKTRQRWIWVWDNVWPRGEGKGVLIFRVI